MSRRESVDRRVDAVGVAKAAGACRVAGVLFSYRCTIACKHCCFGCAQQRTEAAMTPQQCVSALALLHETGRVVHIAGGEAMLYWDRLVEALQLAGEQDVAPHFIETNCSFAVRDELVRNRFSFMARHGVRGLYASADPSPQACARIRRKALSSQ